MARVSGPLPRHAASASLALPAEIQPMPSAETHASPGRLAALGIALTAALAVVAADQGSKYWVVERLNLRGLGAIDVSPVVNFRMAWNKGVNFGILAGDGDLTRWALTLVTGAIGLLLVGAAWQAPGRMRAIGFGIAAGGAFGNILDRWTWGAVADFLNVSCCGIVNPWSFNVADIAVFAGFGLVILASGKPKAARGA